ncbi:MAG: hypothetical protein NTZ32_00050 [Planctomycetales bacterium]|nr:hypothetical protein [Planctomycetales bacterium]
MPTPPQSSRPSPPTFSTTTDLDNPGDIAVFKIYVTHHRQRRSNKHRHHHPAVKLRSTAGG